MDTSGFYKKDPDSGELLYAPNFVQGPSYLLVRENQDDRYRTVDGWRWFNYQQEAQDRL